MPPEDFVRELYRLCFGREADAGGLETWSRVLRRTGDGSAVLAGLLRSPEGVARHGGGDSDDRTALVTDARGRLVRNPRVVDIGAQTLSDGIHPYSPLTALMAVDIVGFDPLSDRLVEREEREVGESGSLTLLPYAIGDGGEHTLHVNNDDATSSLFPLDTVHNSRFNHLSTLETVDTLPVRTHRLDDVLPLGPIDFLKLDVQGAELMVLEGSPLSLARTAVVHCEVEFSTIYRDQPLFSDVAQILAAHGFYLVDLLDQARYHFLDEPRRTSPDRLLWSDAVFFRESEETEVLAAQALIAAVVYDKPSLAGHLLARCRA